MYAIAKGVNEGFLAKEYGDVAKAGWLGILSMQGLDGKIKNVTSQVSGSTSPSYYYNNPIDEFLFETKRGYCEHYASSFTVLMRLADIPARVVTGYQGGEINPIDNYMTLRQSDAHAWSEVYLGKMGWVRVDPTAAIPPGNIEDSADAIRLNSNLKKPDEIERAHV